jgi:hypothetical protein
MIQMNENYGPEVESDFPRVDVDTLCLELLTAIGGYAEEHHFSLDGTRAVIFKSAPQVAINIIMPSTIPQDDRTALEELASSQAEKSAFSPRLNFIYGRTVY